MRLEACLACLCEELLCLSGDNELVLQLFLS